MEGSAEVGAAETSVLSFEAWPAARPSCAIENMANNQSQVGVLAGILTFRRFSIACSNVVIKTQLHP
jgi:hypothetical protein